MIVSVKHVQRVQPAQVDVSKIVTFFSVQRAQYDRYGAGGKKKTLRCFMVRRISHIGLNPANLIPSREEERGLDAILDFVFTSEECGAQKHGAHLTNKTRKRRGK